MKQDSKYYTAQTLYKEGQHPSKVKYAIEQYLKERVNGIPVGIDAKLIFILAKVNLRLKDEKEAEKLFKICIKLDKNNIRARLELGKLYVKQGKEAEAEKLFKKRMQLDPNNVHARLELGKLYAKQGKEAEAEKLFKECIELDSNDVHVMIELGKLYAKQGKDAEAEELFQEVIQIDSKNLYARLELGMLYGKQGKEAEAEKLFKEYMELDSKNMHARVELGKLYVKQGKEAEAEKLFQECIELDPKNVHARLELGLLYKKQGRLEEALKMLNECGELEPDNEGVKKILDEVKGMHDEQETEVKRLVEKYFSQIPAKELQEAKKKFEYFRKMKPRSIHIEKNELMWYLRFKYEHYSLMERFFRVGEDEKGVAMNSATLVVPNDVEIKDGKVRKSQKELIKKVEVNKEYFKQLGDTIKEVNKGYLQRNKEQEH